MILYIPNEIAYLSIIAYKPPQDLKQPPFYWFIILCQQLILYVGRSFYNHLNFYLDAVFSKGLLLKWLIYSRRSYLPPGQLYQFDRDTVAKDHRLGSLNNRTSFSHCLRGQKSQIKELMGFPRSLSSADQDFTYSYTHTHTYFFNEDFK